MCSGFGASGMVVFESVLLRPHKHLSHDGLHKEQETDRERAHLHFHPCLEHSKDCEPTNAVIYFVAGTLG